MSDFENRFSLPHPDRWRDPSIFYTRIANATDEYRKEISDIYFGSSFSYSYNGKAKKYGEIMGAEASEEAIHMLLNIQEHFGIPIAMTLNDMKQPVEFLTDTDLLKEFVQFIDTFYKAGVRRCTISHVHLMNIGILQDKFPEMHWKNTVNNQVRSAQEVIDYATLGYNTIMLDRCLNRDTVELRQIKHVADKYGVETALLASEGCMPACPFKQEHDSWQAELESNTDTNYWEGIGQNTCSRIRRKKIRISKTDRNALPRTSTDIIWVDKEDFDTYAGLVDVFKSWGRLASEPPQEHIHQAFCWVFMPTKGTRQTVWASSFREIYDNLLLPINAWCFNSYIHGSQRNKNWEIIEEANESSVWLTNSGRALSKMLQNCKSQCYSCHACENLYGIEEFDSIVGWIKS